MNKLREVDKTISISKQSKDYKKFKILDESGRTINDPIISLIINRNNFMYGVDDYLNFYFGRMGENRQIDLLRFSNSDSGSPKIGIGGFIDYEKRTIRGTGSIRYGIADTYYFDYYIRDLDSSGELFNIIEDENIPGFEVLISAAYSACCKNITNFPEYIAYFQEKYDKSNHDISRVRKI